MYLNIFVIWQSYFAIRDVQFARELFLQYPYHPVPTWVPDHSLQLTFLAAPTAKPTLFGFKNTSAAPLKINAWINAQDTIFYKLRDHSRVDAQVKIDMSPIGIDISQRWLAAYAIARRRA